jgi:basic membrane lipoprotein Med (substrate-binding protein (PBP1-ABC) superfamily)
MSYRYYIDSYDAEVDYAQPVMLHGGLGSFASMKYDNEQDAVEAAIEYVERVHGKRESSMIVVFNEQGVIKLIKHLGSHVFKVDPNISNLLRCRIYDALIYRKALECKLSEGNLIITNTTENNKCNWEYTDIVNSHDVANNDVVRSTTPSGVKYKLNEFKQKIINNELSKDEQIAYIDKYLLNKE